MEPRSTPAALYMTAFALSAVLAATVETFIPRSCAESWFCATALIALPRCE